MRQRFRFIGREGNRYVWQAYLPGDSRVERITVDIDWFWSGGAA